MTRVHALEVPYGIEPVLRRIAISAEGKMGIALSKKSDQDLWLAVQSVAAHLNEPPAEFAREIAGEGLSDPVVRALAERITVGETYFFREPRVLRAFEEVVLQAYKSDEERNSIRIWCAGCSTGEEAYSIGFILHRLFPEGTGVDFSVLGTDINHRSLEKARSGLYSAWSFRGVDERSVMTFFDSAEGDRRSVKPSLRRGVSFSWLNLAEEDWPLWSDDSPPDVIFCRNVLIYFSEEQISAVLRRFHSTLAQDGWLILAPCESYDSLSPFFSPACYDGATLYRKVTVDEGLEEGCLIRGESDEFESYEVCLEQEEECFLPSAAGMSEAAQTGACLQAVDVEGAFSLEDCLKNARALANIGQLEDASIWVRRSMELDRMAAEPFYLAGLIASELGDEREAVASLRRAIYLAPDFAMAHYGLGGFALRARKIDEANRHFRNAEEILSSLPYEQIIRGGDGVSAGELLQTVRGMKRP